ncbi:MAG: carboxynorspermidine decarboxylase [Methylococcaceae bacterium]|nr:carboxynorspermidine decarboxylase [Methylococcaceae bacterium]
MDLNFLKCSVTSSPAFILDEEEIARNLHILRPIREQSGCQLLYSIKALPFMPLLTMLKPFVDGFSVSSLFEARLANEILTKGQIIHLTTPGIKQEEFDELSRLCSHISFNSLSQLQRHTSIDNSALSMGLRVNPKLSFLKDDRFNPCRQHSKLGIDIDALWQSSCMDQIKGLHIHTVFSATNYQPIIQTIEKLRRYFGKSLAQLDWLNLGGGYLFDQINDHRPFIDTIKQLKNDFGLDIHVEPGKAIVGNSGYLIATVIDRFISDSKTIAILDTSINHNPEVFEYQRQPELHEHDPDGRHAVILAGSTCLAGDVFGEYRFRHPPEIGDKIVFKDVGAYSLIKANRFNGYNLPDIYAYRDSQIILLKRYSYQDYRQQWLAD